LLGSKFYADNPVFPLANTVADLNIDMIGRCDAENCGKDYVYVIGSDMLSTELKKINEKANNETVKLELNYKYDDPNDKNRLYYRSDHYNFAKNGVPVAFYFDGIHEDYHKPSDTPDKIDYNALQKRAQLVFATAWELANRKDRIIVDKK
jgi:Zn-dependent M28 family amino/carboxypeptidase